MPAEVEGKRIEAVWSLLEEEKPERVLEELESFPLDDHPSLYVLKGLAFFELQKFEEALEGFLKVLVTMPDNPVARNHAALCHFHLGRPNTAGSILKEHPVFPNQRFLNKFLRIFWPLRFTTDLVNRPLTNKFPEKPVPLESTWEKAKGLEPNSSRAKKASKKLSAKGLDVYFNQQNAHGALLFERAFELNSEDETIAGYLAHVRLMEGKKVEALEILKPFVVRALDKFSQSKRDRDLPTPELLCSYAFCLHENSRHEEALKVLSGVHPQGVEDQLAHFIASVSWLMLGEEEMFEKALNVALGPYFIDSWEQIVHPFLNQTIDWLIKSSDEA